MNEEDIRNNFKRPRGRPVVKTPANLKELSPAGLKRIARFLKVADADAVEEISRILVSICKDGSDKRLQADAMKLFYSYLFQAMQMESPTKPKEGTDTKTASFSKSDIRSLLEAHEGLRSKPMILEKEITETRD